MSPLMLPMGAGDGVRHWADKALGEDAVHLGRRLNSAIDPTLSVAFGGKYWDLGAAYAEAAEENWDGYGAQPVTPATWVAAWRFLTALPRSVPDPQIGVDPDGEIAFTWRRSSDRIFSISVGGDGRLSYAGIFGKANEHGTVEFLGEIPEAVPRLLARVFRGSTQAG